jgi:energy-coupling factor transporter ATP-binding protein EcfA2
MKVINSNITNIASGISKKDSFVLYDFINKKGDKVSLDSKRATENVLVTGATGSGKTTSVLMPMFHQLLVNNCGGLVLDVKGELYKMMTLVAKKTGQEGRIRILGLNEFSSSFNIFCNFTHDIFKSFLTQFTAKQGKSLYWFEMGIENLIDLVKLDDELYKVDQQKCMEPQFTRMYNLLTNPKCSQQIERDIKRLASGNYSKGDLEYVDLTEIISLYRKISADKFHFFNMFKDIEYNHDDFMQVTWRTDELISTMSLLKEDEISGKINDIHNSKTLEQMIFDDNEIVIFVGDISQPVVSKNIASAVRNAFFTQLISRDQDEIDYEKPSFLMIDEYQSFVSFKNNMDVLSDESFTSLSRSFNHINICATQSIASLYRYADNSYAVDMLIQNFVNKIFLSTDCKRNYQLAKDLFEFEGETMADIPTKSLVAQRGDKVGLAKINTSEGVEFQSFAPTMNTNSMHQYLISDVLKTDLINFRKNKREEENLKREEIKIAELKELESLAKKAGFESLEGFEKWSDKGRKVKETIKMNPDELFTGLDGCDQSLEEIEREMDELANDPNNLFE